MSRGGLAAQQLTGRGGRWSRDDSRPGDAVLDSEPGGSGGEAVRNNDGSSRRLAVLMAPSPPSPAVTPEESPLESRSK